MFLHASCISIENQGVLIMGASGVGKSDLALRLIDRGAKLVSDDQTELYVDGAVLYARPPKTIAGKLEVRYVGIAEMPYEPSVPIVLAVELITDKAQLERLPEPFSHSFLDCAVKGLRLPSYEASLPEKIRLALQGSFLDV